MKVAFVGKGGSGKTTLTTLVAQYLAVQNMPVLAIDADINQHLGYALGGCDSAPPPMGIEMERIKEYLRGTNKRFTVSDMIKTTPPGGGSNLLTFHQQNPLWDYFIQHVRGVRLMAVGPFMEEDLGTKCYHSKTGAVELLLNHFADKEHEYVLVDMTAGADSFASGLFTRFDITFLVVEPTLKSLEVYKQYSTYAQNHHVHIKVIGNKICDTSDVEFLRAHVGNALIATCSQSAHVRAMEKGSFLPIDNLEPANKIALDAIIQKIDNQKKDWNKFYKQAVEFHLKNAKSWANAATGKDLATHIDPAFSLEKAIRQL